MNDQYGPLMEDVMICYNLKMIDTRIQPSSWHLEFPYTSSAHIASFPYDKYLQWSYIPLNILFS